MLLLADWVIPVSSRPLADAGVRVSGGRITEVGPAAQLRARYEGEKTRTFPGCALLPGFVNTHTHLELSAFRGFARPSGFGRWLLNLLLARRKLDQADYEVSALWGAREAARCGITSFADTAYDGLAVTRAAAAAGLRARVYQEVFGLDDAALPQTMERYQSVIARLRGEAAAGPTGGDGAPLREIGVSPHAPYTVSARLYREAARFARRAGLRLATHVAESSAEVELLARGTGPIARAYRLAQLWTGAPWTPPRQRPVQYVAAAGALSAQTLVIHAVEIEAEDIATLAASGASVAHCPRSNARLRCAQAPVAELLAAGVGVGLGTDSLASNDSLDMFAEMRAALVAAERRAEASGTGVASGLADVAAGPGSAAPYAPATLSAEQVLRMATLDGARALGWDGLTGSVEVGKSADLIAVRIPAGPAIEAPLSVIWGAASAAPPGIAASLVAGASAADVRLTMVAGRVVFEAGASTKADAADLGAVRQKLGLGR